MIPTVGRPVASSLLAVACWLLFGSPGRLVAEIRDLPAEIALDAEVLSFDLAASVVKIEVRSDAEPVLRARVTQEDHSARLEALGQGGTLTVRRPADEDGLRPPRLRIEAVLAPGQRLVLTGSDLDLTINDAPPAAVDPALLEEEAADSALSLPSPPSHSVFQLALASSEADLTGLQSPVLELVQTSVWLTGTTGNLSLKLMGGAAEIRDHRGVVNLSAAGAEVAVESLDGALMGSLEGGSLAVSGGGGVLSASAQSVALLLDGWRGRLQLTGDDNTLEARAGGQAKIPWTFEGQGLSLVLDGIDASVVAKLDGGSLRGSGLRFPVEVTARNGARMELSDLQGPFKLTLTDGAEARLSGVKAALTAELDDAVLRADGIERLGLTATRSQVTAYGISHLARLEATDSELDLEFDGIGLNPSLYLRGTSVASVRLTTPCLVELERTAPPADSRVRLSGCDLLVPGQRLRGREALLRYGSERPITLKAALYGDATLEIEGRP